LKTAKSTLNKFADKPLPERQIFITSVIFRMLAAYQKYSNTDLLTALNTSMEQTTSWILEGVLPQKEAFQCHIDTQVSLDWILHGKQQRSNPLAQPEVKEQLTAHIEQQLNAACSDKTIKENQLGGTTTTAKLITESLIKLNEQLQSDKATEDLLSMPDDTRELFKSFLI
jgi:hypothetical protein